MTFSSPHPLLHRHIRDTWARRLTVTMFLTAGTLVRWTGDGHHRAVIATDPYDDAR